MIKPVSIGSITGSFLGILPGVGGQIAAFISYDYTKKLSINQQDYGKGCIEGIAVL